MTVRIELDYTKPLWDNIMPIGFEIKRDWDSTERSRGKGHRHLQQVLVMAGDYFLLTQSVNKFGVSGMDLLVTASMVPREAFKFQVVGSLSQELSGAFFSDPGVEGLVRSGDLPALVPRLRELRAKGAEGRTSEMTERSGA